MNELQTKDVNQLIVELHNALTISSRALQKTEALVKELQPKADFYDVVTQSAKELDMKQAAKILNYDKMGRNKWFRMLRRAGVLMNNNEPYQSFVNQKYFRIIIERFTTSDGREMIYKKTVVLPKGLDFMRRKINEYLATTEN